MFPDDEEIAIVRPIDISVYCFEKTIEEIVKTNNVKIIFHKSEDGISIRVNVVVNAIQKKKIFLQ